MPRLRSLVLEKTEVGDDGVAALASLGSLSRLDLSRTGVRGSEASYAALRQMGQLKELLLAYCQVDLQLALNLPRSLERLKLSRVLAFDDDALLCLARETSERALRLTHLDLGSQGITDRSIRSLCCIAEAAPLTSLTLWHSKVTAVGISSLMQLTGLQLDTSMASSDGTYLLGRRAADLSQDGTLGGVAALS